MSFTATGPILLLLALYVFAFRPTQLAYWAVFFAPFSATAIVNFKSLGYKSGGLGLTPAMAFTMFFFAAHFVYGYGARKVRISSGHLVQMGLIALFLMTIYMSLISNMAMGTLVNPVPTHTVYITIGLGAAVLFSLEFARDDANIEKAIRVARASALFVCFWGLLQLVCSIVHVPYPEILFNNSNSDSADMFAQSVGTISRISSVAVEPSVLAAGLLYFASFGVTVLSRDARLRTRYWYWSVAFVVATLVLSTSSTAYVGLVVLTALLVLERPLFALLAGVPLLTIFLGVLATVPSARAILWENTFNKSASSSYADRTSASIADYAEFLKHPLFGNGWGRASNFNAVTTLLCDVGVIGSALFVTCGALTIGALILGANNSNDDDWKMSAYAAGLRNALIVGAVCAITSGMKYVFLSDWVFWGLGIAVASRLEVTQRAKQRATLWVSPRRESVSL